MVLAYTPITRQRNFVNDAANSIPITASYMDGELNQLVSAANGTLVAQGTAPSSPFNGEFWFNTTLNQLELYRNNEWVIYNPIHSGAVMATPQNNDLWINAANGMNHLKMYDGINWNDIPALKNLNGVNWQLPAFNGVNWTDLYINKGVNWNTLNPILFNGVNWDDPSYSPAANSYWKYQSFGNTPKWNKITINNWVPTNCQSFTSTANWTDPAGITTAYVRLWAGGGGSDNASHASGGGEYTEAPDAVTGNVVVTIGLGGAGVGSGTGNTGGTTSFAGTVTLTALGGTGSSSSTNGSGGTGGTNTNGFSIPGQNGSASTGGASGILTGPQYGYGGGPNQASGNNGFAIVCY